MKNFARFTNSPRTLLILAFILNLTGFLVGYFLMPYFTLYYFGLSIVCAIVFTFVFAKKIKPNKLKTIILIMHYNRLISYLYAQKDNLDICK